MWVHILGQDWYFWAPSFFFEFFERAFYYILVFVFFCINTFHFKVLMRTGVFRVSSFIYIFYFKPFMRTRIFIRFFCLRFYVIQSSYSDLVHLHFSFQRFDKGYVWYFKVCYFYLAKGKAFFKIGKMLPISLQKIGKMISISLQL